MINHGCSVCGSVMSAFGRRLVLAALACLKQHPEFVSPYTISIEADDIIEVIEQLEQEGWHE